MRNSPAILAIAAAAIGAVHGCTLPLAGLSPDSHGGGGSSAGGAPSTVTGATMSASSGTDPSTSTGVMACTTQGQCPSDTPCLTYACKKGQCLATPRSEGVEIPDDDGNCKKTACKDGVLEAQTDLDDVGDDSNPCTQDTCDDDGPRHDPGSNGSACGPPGQHCLDGQCRECASDGDCSEDGNVCSAPVCNAGTCGQKKVGGACYNGGVSFCDGGSCCPSSKICYFQCCSPTEHCTLIGCRPN